MVEHAPGNRHVYFLSIKTGAETAPIYNYLVLTLDSHTIPCTETVNKQQSGTEIVPTHANWY